MNTPNLDAVLSDAVLPTDAYEKFRNDAQAELIAIKAKLAEYESRPSLEDNVVEIATRLEAVEKLAREGVGVDGAIRLVEFVDRARSEARIGQFERGWNEARDRLNIPPPAGLLLPWGTRLKMRMDKYGAQVDAVTPDGTMVFIISATLKDFGIVPLDTAPKSNPYIADRLLTEGNP